LLEESQELYAARRVKRSAKHGSLSHLMIQFAGLGLFAPLRSCLAWMAYLRKCHTGSNFFLQCVCALTAHIAFGGIYVAEHPAPPFLQKPTEHLDKCDDSDFVAAV